MPDAQCPQCGSAKTWRDGIRNTYSGQVQRFLCRNCGYRFSEAKSMLFTINKGGIDCTEQQCSQVAGNSRKALSIPKLQEKRCAAAGGAAALSECVEMVDTQLLKSKPSIQANCQIRAFRANGAKNLDAAEKQSQAAGISPQLTADAKGKIIEYAWWMKKEGYSDATIAGRAKLLRILTRRGANLYDPETVKNAIAKQAWSEGRKANAVDAYSSFLKMAGGQWEPPRYQGVRKIPFIPKETEIDQLISGCSKRIATFLQLLKETGMRCGEAWQLKWIDVDVVTKTVRVTPEKNSNPRIAKISQKLTGMLENLPKNYDERIFSTPQMPLDNFRDAYCEQRKRITFKLQNPRLLRITFHTLRHWKGTMEYHRTKDILYVMQVLGHKNIKNTLIYVQLAEELFKDEDDYVSKVAKTEADICLLVEAGFEFVCDFNGAKIFRKKK